MTQVEDSALPATTVHGVPGGEPAIAKGNIETLEKAEEVTESKPGQKSSQDDYDSQPETKAGLGNFWVGFFPTMASSGHLAYLFIENIVLFEASRCRSDICSYGLRYGGWCGTLVSALGVSTLMRLQTLPLMQIVFGMSDGNFFQF